MYCSMEINFYAIHHYIQSLLNLKPDNEMSYSSS